MDRDKRWDRVEKAYNAMVAADGPRFADAPAVVADAYANKKFDEFVLPAVVGDYHGMKDGDGVLCFNFRADRVREILSRDARPRSSPGSSASAPCASPPPSAWRNTATELDKLMDTIFPPQTLEHILGEVVAEAGRKQLRMAETEKYAARHLFSQRRPRGALRGRGPHHGAVAQGGDLRSAAGDVGARTDRRRRSAPSTPANTT